MTKEGPRTSNPRERSSSLEQGEKVKESWFRAYVAGNLTLPLTFIAINIFVADAVLEDPNIDWEKFSRSELSPEQVKELGEIMSKVHAQRKSPIMRAAEGQTHHFEGKGAPKIIPENRFSNLWKTARHGVGANLLQAITGKWQNTAFGKMEGRELNLIFKDPKEFENIKIFREVISVLKKVFQGHKIHKFFKIYRGNLRNENHEDKMGIGKKIREKAEVELRAKGLDPDSVLINRILVALL